MLNVGKLNEGVVLDHIAAGKSMDIMVHKSALPKDLKKKLGIN